MTRPMIRIQDLSTDEIIDREMNDEEFAQYQLDLQTAADNAKMRDAAEAARNALLKRLGITADEAKLLLG